jgi:hypothetical protein
MIWIAAITAVIMILICKNLDEEKKKIRRKTMRGE